MYWLHVCCFIKGKHIEYLCKQYVTWGYPFAALHFHGICWHFTQYTITWAKWPTPLHFTKVSLLGCFFFLSARFGSNLLRQLFRQCSALVRKSYISGSFWITICWKVAFISHYVNQIVTSSNTDHRVLRVCKRMISHSTKLINKHWMVQHNFELWCTSCPYPAWKWNKGLECLKALTLCLNWRPSTQECFEWVSELVYLTLLLNSQGLRSDGLAAR